MADEVDVTYQAALELVERIDDDLTRGVRHFWDTNGRLLQTLDQVVRAILDGTFVNVHDAIYVWLSSEPGSDGTAISPAAFDDYQKSHYGVEIEYHPGKIMLKIPTVHLGPETTDVVAGAIAMANLKVSYRFGGRTDE